MAYDNDVLKLQNSMLKLCWNAGKRIIQRPKPSANPVSNRNNKTNLMLAQKTSISFGISEFRLSPAPLQDSHSFEEAPQLSIEFSYYFQQLIIVM